MAPQRGSGRRENVCLQLPDLKATRLETLEGNLLVLNGVVRELSFRASELQAGYEKNNGQVNVRIESVKESGQGLEVGISYLAPRPPQQAV